MKKIWNSFKIAFSMYSKIPMPGCEWTKENMSFVFVFFPWIGAVIGALMYGIYQGKEYGMAHGCQVSEVTFAVIFVLLPLALTGGIHMDGFLDTQDALSSWQDREKRLEILKDPHVGAFAIISGGFYLLAQLGVYASAGTISMRVIACSFFLSRAMSGLSVLYFPQARPGGMAATFEAGTKQKTVRIILIGYLVISGVTVILAGGLTGLASLLVAASVFWYYYRMAIEEFGGVTGDLAGYFLQVCELLMAAAAVAVDLVL